MMRERWVLLKIPRCDIDCQSSSVLANRLIGHWSQVSFVLQFDILPLAGLAPAKNESHAGNNGHYVPPAVRTDMPWVS